MHYFFSLALIALASFALAADVCSSILAGQVSCLGSNAQASSYCTSMMLPSQTSTTTVTVTDTGAVVTVTTTAIESFYTTEGGTATIYSASTIATTSQETVTTYLSGGSAAKRAASTCDGSSVLSQLSMLQSMGLSSACSCIGAVPTATTLATQAIVTATVTAGAGSTTTTTQTGQVKFTVSASTVVPYTVASSFTQTSTVTLAAPSFTQVWGPGSGCVDVEPTDVDSLDSTVKQAEAVSLCQDGCAQLSSCAFVYVQWSFDGYQEGVSPFYKCYYNNHTLDVSNDLECNKQTNIWGTATGYNAIDRGT